MTTDEYNGWSNRETWAVALHIDNDEGLHQARRAMCARAYQYSNPNVPDAKARRGFLARELQEWVESIAEDFYFNPCEWKHLGPMFSDIGSLWRVNWLEIADNWVTDLEEYNSRN